MINMKLIMGGALASFGADYIGDTVSDLYKGSSLQSFINDDLGLGSVFQNDRIDKAIKGVAKTAIEQGIVPDYGATPTTEKINPKLSPIGSTGDFQPFSQGQNLLYRGTQGAIDKALTKTGVRQFVIGHVSASKVVNPRIQMKRTIGTQGTPLKLAALKRGQIEGAR